MICEGAWWLKSKTDPRWDCMESNVSVGSLVIPPSCQYKIEQLTKKLGEPPDDLTWEYHKY